MLEPQPKPALLCCIPWLCDGICDVVKVWLFTFPPDVEKLLFNAVVNPLPPPELALPETTLKALLLCAVLLVQPVGALVWLNNIVVPDGNAARPVKAEPSTAGKAAGNLASGIVPDVKLDALNAVKSIVSNVGSAPLFALRNLPLLLLSPCNNLASDIELSASLEPAIFAAECKSAFSMLPSSIPPVDTLVSAIVS